jgi:hypothetical protein
VRIDEEKAKANGFMERVPLSVSAHGRYNGRLVTSRLSAKRQETFKTATTSIGSAFCMEVKGCQYQLLEWKNIMLSDEEKLEITDEFEEEREKLVSIYFELKEKAECDNDFFEGVCPMCLNDAIMRVDDKELGIRLHQHIWSMGAMGFIGWVLSELIPEENKVKH